MSQILVIEDDPIVLAALVAVLSLAEMNPVPVDHPEALAGVLGDRPAPDLILVDWRLPDGVTGRDVAEAVQCHYGRELPVLVLTGESIETVERLVAEGHRVIRKPVAASDLIKTITSMIGSR